MHLCDVGRVGRGEHKQCAGVEGYEGLVVVTEAVAVFFGHVSHLCFALCGLQHVFQLVGIGHSCDESLLFRFRRMEDVDRLCEVDARLRRLLEDSFQSLLGVGAHTARQGLTQFLQGFGVLWVIYSCLDGQRLQVDGDDFGRLCRDGIGVLDGRRARSSQYNGY